MTPPSRRTALAFILTGLLWSPPPGAAAMPAAAMPAAATPAAANDDASAVVARGEGPGVVLLSGLLGGVARLAPLADSLVSRGFHVVAIDPYRLAAHEPDVSFHGLAAVVERTLARHGVRSAVVVAHAHAAGIALRLAANAPERVASLVLIEGGVMASTRSAGVTRAMRVASVVARLPGGSSLIRARLESGIRANSGRAAWLSESAARAYTDPFLRELPAVARMAGRLASAHEPEPSDAVLRRLAVRTILLVGAVPHDFAPRTDELAPLVARPLVRLVRVEGVGHFVHEEALPLVVREVAGAQAPRVVER